MWFQNAAVGRPGGWDPAGRASRTDSGWRRGCDRSRRYTSCRRACCGRVCRPASGCRRRVRVVAGRTVFIVVADIPIVDELPDIAGHVVKAVAVGAVATLPGVLGAGPGEVLFAMELAIEKAHRRGPWQRARAERILRFGPVGFACIRVIAPGEILIETVFAAAGGVFPFGLGGQAVAAL